MRKKIRFAWRMGPAHIGFAQHTGRAHIGRATGSGRRTRCVAAGSRAKESHLQAHVFLECPSKTVDRD